MGLTFALTWLRIQYDGTKPVHQLIEAALGGAARYEHVRSILTKGRLSASYIQR